MTNNIRPNSGVGFFSYLLFPFIGFCSRIRTWVENITGQQDLCVKMFTGPPEFLPVLPVVCSLRNKAKLKNDTGQLERGVKVVPVRQKNYQKLSAGPACISDAVL